MKFLFDDESFSFETLRAAGFARGVALHVRRISNPDLHCNVVQDHQQRIQQIAQERLHMTNRDQLQRESQRL